jgi:murein endopeptidase
VLDHLAEVRTDPKLDIAALMERVRQRTDGGLVVALLGLLTQDEAEIASGLRVTGGPCVGFLIDATTWLHLPPEARTHADQHHALTRLTLARNGWRVVDVAHGSKLSALWHQAAVRGSQGFAHRAPMAETIKGGAT